MVWGIGNLSSAIRAQTGEYAGLQKSDTQAWCVDPLSGEVLQSSTDSNGGPQCPGSCNVARSKALLRETGRGYIPQCENERGVFSSEQCSEDQDECWCVFENGEEAPGTRVSGKRTSCEPNSKIQQCRVICSLGFQHFFSEREILLCDMENHLWIGDPPHSKYCQRIQPFQSVRMQTQFQLLLPPEKACSPDYSGLLEAFQIFILDEMKAHGFCHIQHLVTVPVCGDSTVLVQCLAVDRLGVNVTWRALLEDVPAASLPDLHNIEKAMVGENLMGRFEALIRSGGFLLHLDNKQFQADTSISFPRNEDFDISPQVRLECTSGFQKVVAAEGAPPNLQGCGITNCQMDERDVQCDENGQYRPSYVDPTTKKSFCVDIFGEILEWTEMTGSLMDSQCLEENKPNKCQVSFTEEAVEIVGSITIPGELESALQQCIAGQEFTTAGVKIFEMTDFQDVVSGVYHNLVLSVAGTSLTDVHLFCRQTCSQDSCCDGFILSQIVLDGASDPIEETEAAFITFQRVYLWRGSDMMTQARSIACGPVVPPTEMNPLLPGIYLALPSAIENFSLMESSQILIEQNRSLQSQEYWLFQPRFSAEQAHLWCLAPAQICNNPINNIPENCNIVLPWKPHLLYQKTVSLKGSVKNFYTRLPFQKMSRISVSSKIDVSGKTVSNGFFDCERLCDADPCCSGFGLLNTSQDTGGKVLCLTLNSLGVQTCTEELRSDWQVSDCTSLEAEVKVHPFGWYQKAATIPRVCPPVLLLEKQESVTLDKWQRVDGAAILIDPSISKYDVIHVSRDASSDFATVRDFCLTVCAKEKLCLVTTLDIQSSATRCMFYPETQTCTLGLQGHYCRLLLKEPATYIYRRQGAFGPTTKIGDALSVNTPLQGSLFGTSQVVRVGSSWKRIKQFLGVPYAAPPVAESRFRPPQAFTPAESWNATMTR
ncbi:hypothetical protein JD844_015618 [Phrynosoma platyrhinos]|uniref:Thyroglobulin type-1 domain-containing protein n=1 Tax=Phrynosoma platyrhinos TaxID=52577 RepID=A0ABQ7SJ96_PHRPL|nr:hypothetical protein JD844_015618 [Phrynosoma platyrhinos]